MGSEARLRNSISGYYYTGTRNLFVGSLCAISMFMLCCRGYDRKDEIAGFFGDLCSGRRFLSDYPDDHWTKLQHDIGIAHYTFATLLFSILASPTIIRSDFLTL